MARTALSFDDRGIARGRKAIEVGVVRAHRRRAIVQRLVSAGAAGAEVAPVRESIRTSGGSAQECDADPEGRSAAHGRG